MGVCSKHAWVTAKHEMCLFHKTNLLFFNNHQFKKKKDLIISYMEHFKFRLFPFSCVYFKVFKLNQKRGQGNIVTCFKSECFSSHGLTEWAASSLADWYLAIFSLRDEEPCDLSNGPEAQEQILGRPAGVGHKTDGNPDLISAYCWVPPCPQMKCFASRTCRPAGGKRRQALRAADCPVGECETKLFQQPWLPTRTGLFSHVRLVLLQI